jgi:transcriptional regulator with XRE-family HTH domain
MSNLPTHSLAGVFERRKLLNISAAECGQAIGISANAFNRLERGERILSLPKGITLAKLLSCTVEELSESPSVDERLAVLHQHQAAASATTEPTSSPPAPAAAKPGRPAVWTQEKAIKQALADARREAGRVTIEPSDHITAVDGTIETNAERTERLRSSVENNSPEPAPTDQFKLRAEQDKIAEAEALAKLITEWEADDD